MKPYKTNAENPIRKINTDIHSLIKEGIRKGINKAYSSTSNPSIFRIEDEIFKSVIAEIENKH